jgi:hypothetical protein
MAQYVKRQPSIPPGPRSIDENLALALKDETIRRKFSVRMIVRGGMPSQAYSFEFSLAGDGTAECRLERRGPVSERESGSTQLAERDLVALLRRLKKALRLPEEPPSFWPDTVVGILEISDGATVRRLYFAADPEQARTQGKTPAPALLEAVNAIYLIGTKLTKSRSVKP